MIINEMIESYQEQGLNEFFAKIKVLQDIFMIKLEKSKYSNNITFKGGTVMFQITKEKRRTTKDLDIDLINLGLDRITSIINEIGKWDEETKTTFYVLENKTEKLSHEDYEGKRLFLEFKDEKLYKTEMLIDIGVHKHLEINQEILFFDVIGSKKGVELLANPIEQMIVEKTSAIIKFGTFTTRIKDIFDIYYLINNSKYKKDVVLEYIKILFLKTEKTKSILEYKKRIKETLSSKRIKNKLNESDNWLDVESEDIVESIIKFFNSLK
ncbi:MAG: nucleotidyl transferase AbiEii/AbiGii toxin family protein [Acholeplasmataceae bacterium]|nr:nucleotidyl transferase AbiEii/AbiGii toxin family protein [Acholeplasmataceae bacterium]